MHYATVQLYRCTVVVQCASVQADFFFSKQSGDGRWPACDQQPSFASAAANLCGRRYGARDHQRPIRVCVRAAACFTDATLIQSCECFSAKTAGALSQLSAALAGGGLDFSANLAKRHRQRQAGAAANVKDTVHRLRLVRRASP